ncbi:helix-turn-helix transcriptional regulator [Herpetosiphon gulosus]|uniref:HTH cro/C1-type domain-containing protein n=1 Tax=Herpetosiphon gulosus TaxID=1973496 RepID=A0ABP9WWR2_9CHLR
MVIRFKIQEIAEQKGIVTAAELAREAKIGQATAYSLWNNNRSDANYSTLLVIGKVLGVKPDDLVEVNEDEKIELAHLTAA